MKAMLLAAGLGTRLRPLTNALPKPMVPLLNRPLIGWIVEHAMAAGVRDFIVNLHYLPEAIEQYLPGAFPQATFTFSYEPEILGTGGGVRKVRALLEGEEDFFLANGDTIQRPPLAALRAARRSTDALAALTLRRPPEGDRYTAVWFEAAESAASATPLASGLAGVRSGRITGFGEGTGEPLMFSGSHCISRRLFDLLPDRPVSGIVEDVYRTMSAPLAGVAFDDALWFDIGTPQRYLGATRALLLLDRAPSAFDASGIAGTPLLHPTTRVGGELTRSVAGARSVVDGTLIDSVVWDDCHIASGVRLVNCIVGHGVELDRGEFANTMICKEGSELVFTSF